MGIVDVLLIAVALSMDAAAVSMAEGMCHSKMPFKRAAITGGFFGVFQGLMPLIGYFITKLFASAFIDTFRQVSAWVSFLLLVVIGGKMIFDSVKEMLEKRKNGGGRCELTDEKLSLGKLTLQAIATSIDALAVGVTLQMAAIGAEGLFPAIGWTVCIIGAITFILSVASVYIGKLIGDRLADKAELIGGLVLVGIGIKLLVEGLMG